MVKDKQAFTFLRLLALIRHPRLTAAIFVCPAAFAYPAGHTIARQRFIASIFKKRLTLHCFIATKFYSPLNASLPICHYFLRNIVVQRFIAFLL
jgi:hypothetical protein